MHVGAHIAENDIDGVNMLLKTNNDGVSFSPSLPLQNYITDCASPIALCPI
jgi:hypothetical protein